MKKQFLVIYRTVSDEILYRVFTGSDELEVWRSIVRRQGSAYSVKDPVEQLKHTVAAYNQPGYHSGYKYPYLVVFDVSEDNVSNYEARGILVRDVLRRAFSGEERNIVVGDLNKLFQFDDCALTDVDE